MMRRHRQPKPKLINIGKGRYMSDWEYVESELALLQLIEDESSDVNRADQIIRQRLKATANAGSTLKATQILRHELSKPERLLVLSVLRERILWRGNRVGIRDIRQSICKAGLGMHTIAKYLNPEGRLFRRHILRLVTDGLPMDREYRIHTDFLKLLESKPRRASIRKPSTYQGWIQAISNLLSDEYQNPAINFTLVDKDALVRFVSYPKDKKANYEFFKVSRRCRLNLTERQLLAILLAGHVFYRRWDFTVESLLAAIETPISRCFDHTALFAKNSRLLKAKLVERESSWLMPDVCFLGSTSVRLSAEGAAALLPKECLYDSLDDGLLKDQPSLLSLDDLILPDSIRCATADIIAFARNGKVLLNKWDLERITYGSGLGALFYGPPGTGKTALAGAIAKSLDRPLQVMETSKILSPWVGMTERIMERVFVAAEKTRAVLFIDEADSFLQSREQAMHSWESTQVNTLLRLIERFNGLVILATNHEMKLDKALDRRLQYKLAFPMPDQTARQRLWVKMLGSKVPLAEDVDLSVLASIPLSGGQIKNAVLAGCIRATQRSGMAGPVTLQDLTMAAQAENKALAQKTAFVAGFKGGVA
ncbi:MAG TPA: hypothetical protein DCR97_13510 [Deltaproteobacteria bacterium]|jgi:adenylate kinase family enzyme|nr:hypothetical protein [Deltaproteobacteria bacterium]